MEDRALNIEIRSGRKSTYEHRGYLYSQGLRFDRRTRAWICRTHDRELASRLKDFCRMNGCVFISYDDSRRRSHAYRDAFFESTEPMFLNRYVCAYCFVPIRKDDTTVDHIISIRKGKANRAADLLLRRLEIDDINDPRNLCACCRSCNSRKGSKAGVWVIRGFLGKRRWFVSVIYALVLAMTVVALYGLYISITCLKG